MRQKFSERHGFSKPREKFQIKRMNDALKNRLWNTIKYHYIDPMPTHYDNINDLKWKSFINEIYDAFFKVHDEPYWMKSTLTKDLKNKYFNLEWFDIYDFIEFLPTVFPDPRINKAFRDKINNVLKKEISGYHFIDEFIVSIIEETEIQEIDEALASPYKSIKIHLSKALELLSDKENPDYINSIKESISAVEALCQIFTGKDKYDLGKCLKELDLDINKQFKNGMNILYGWTSSEDGIRHANTGETIVSDFAEAKYMLVSCSAFINYMIEKNQ